MTLLNFDSGRGDKGDWNKQLLSDEFFDER